jgi:basic amino acid/polyamine antiporter, APA family
MENEQQEGLKREIGILDVAVNVVNISIASGIFLLPAIIAGILGNVSFMAYILCGTMFLLITLCYAEVSSRITSTGGAYTYMENAFGEFIGFIGNSLVWFGCGVLVSAAFVNGIADVLSVSFPIFANSIFRGLFFMLLLGFCAFFNIRGIKQGMNVIKFITLIKALPLVLLVVVGLFYLKSDNLHWEKLPTFQSLGEASLILFFAFTGGEMSVNISGEMKNPNRTAPLGLLLGIGTIIVFYCLIQFVAQGVLGSDILNHKEAPLAAVAGVLFGNFGVTLLTICSVLAIFGSLNSVVLLFPRTLYAGAKDGALPHFLSKIHPQYATPYWSIIVFCSMAFLMAISGGFKQLIILATASILLIHLGVVLAVIKFKLKKEIAPTTSFKLYGGLTIPIIALVVILWLLFQLKPDEVMAMGIFMAILSVIYLVFNRKVNNDE